MPYRREIPDPAHLVDTGGFEIEKYCGAFLLPGDEGLAIVDSGPSVTTETTLAAIQELGFTPEEATDILPTHRHLGDATATWRLFKACPSTRTPVHESELAF